MLPLGLRRKDLRALHRLLRQNHRIHVRVQLLDLEHNHLQDLSNRLLEGQVNVDADADVSRSLDLVLRDPNHTLHLDSDSPEEGAMYMDRMLRIVYSVAEIADEDDEDFDWIDIPVFCGPITKLERTDTLLSIEAQGKETLAFASMWRVRTFKEGLAKTTVIQRIFKQILGETKLSIPEKKERIPRKLSLGVSSSPWKVSKHLARTLNQLLFYDGRGRLRMKPRGGRSVLRFTDKMVKSMPQVSYDTENVRNAVLVIGAKPKGANKRIRVRRVAGKKHPLSPSRLGRDGVKRYIPIVIQDDSIRTKSQARKVAKRTLRTALLESVEVSFDSLVYPHLEEMDVCKLDLPEYSMEFPLRKFTIPLTADGTSSIGYLRRTSPKRRAIRGRRRKS